MNLPIPYDGLIVLLYDVEHVCSEEWVGYPILICEQCNVPWPCDAVIGQADEPIKLLPLPELDDFDPSWTTRPQCVCAETSTRNCEVHGNGEGT